MTDYFTINTIRNILDKKEILKGNFGLEKEGIRIKEDGQLAQTPHPEIFGDKLENPYITTDFSESQVEIVTPTFTTIKETYQFLSFIADIVNTNIQEDEYIWNNSLPCILPKPEDIPIAQYNYKENGKKAEEYRQSLAKKYGTKKQMISGIHYNFSFNEETIEKLYNSYPEEITYKEFKNQLYLKIVRNYLRYKWLVIYLTGCSVGAHETFTTECTDLMNKKDSNNSYYSTEGVSFRNASCGYKNLVPLYPRYDNTENFINDVNKFIDDGLLSEAKELYTQIRLKPKDRDNFLESIAEDGILYIELRTVDINPFDKCGISEEDMEFLHIFIIYLLLKSETDYNKWQEEGLLNEETVAEKAFSSDTRLLKDGTKITVQKWGLEILDEIKEMNDKLELDKEDLINQIREKIENPEKTYAKQLSEIYKNTGYIKSQIDIAKNNKQTSTDILSTKHIENNEKLYTTYNKALPNK